MSEEILIILAASETAAAEILRRFPFGPDQAEVYQEQTTSGYHIEIALAGLPDLTAAQSGYLKEAQTGRNPLVWDFGLREY